MSLTKETHYLNYKSHELVFSTDVLLCERSAIIILKRLFDHTWDELFLKVYGKYGFSINL